MLWASGITGVSLLAGSYTNTDDASLQWLARIAFAPDMPVFFAFWVSDPSIEGIPSRPINPVFVAIATFVIWWIIVEVGPWPKRRNPGVTNNRQHPHAARFGQIQAQLDHLQKLFTQLMKERD